MTEETPVPEPSDFLDFLDSLEARVKGETMVSLDLPDTLECRVLKENPETRDHPEHEVVTAFLEQRANQAYQEETAYQEDQETKEKSVTWDLWALTDPTESSDTLAFRE